MDMTSVLAPVNASDNAASCGIVSSGDGQTGKKMNSLDMWSSIISRNQGTNGVSSGDIGSCYVHPLARRNSSLLSEKSLKVCTESLGSETGSEGFSSYTPLEIHEDSNSDSKSGDDQPLIYNEESQVGVGMVRYHSFIRSRKSLSQAKRFPPPIPSLSHGGSGRSLHLRRHCHDERLVLEAVSILSMNVFHARRQNGRLLLTLDAPQPIDEKKQEEAVKEEEDEDDDHATDVDGPAVSQQIIRGCKEQPRRSLVVWKPYCIATI